MEEKRMRTKKEIEGKLEYFKNCNANSENVEESLIRTDEAIKVLKYVLGIRPDII